jgi:hypothetical protein
MVSVKAPLEIGLFGAEKRAFADRLNLLRSPATNELIAPRCDARRTMERAMFRNAMLATTALILGAFAAVPPAAAEEASSGLRDCRVKFSTYAEEVAWHDYRRAEARRAREQSQKSLQEADKARDRAKHYEARGDQEAADFWKEVARREDDLARWQLDLAGEFLGEVLLIPCGSRASGPVTSRYTTTGPTPPPQELAIPRTVDPQPEPRKAEAPQQSSQPEQVEAPKQPQKPASASKPLETMKKKVTKKIESKTGKSGIKKVAKNRQPAERRYRSADSQAAALVSNMLIENLVAGAVQYGMAKQRKRHLQHSDGEFRHDAKPRRHKKQRMTSGPTFTAYTVDPAW